MALRTEEKEIDGLAVSTTQLGAWKALGLVPRLGKLLAPALAKLASMPGAGKVSEADLSAIAPALASLFASMDGNEAQALVRDLLAGTSVKVEGDKGPRKVELTNPGAIDGVFEGRLMTLFRVVWFALSVNFTDFIDAASTLSQATARPAAVTA